MLLSLCTVAGDQCGNFLESILPVTIFLIFRRSFQHNSVETWKLGGKWQYMCGSTSFKAIVVVVLNSCLYEPVAASTNIVSNFPLDPMFFGLLYENTLSHINPMQQSNITIQSIQPIYTKSK